MPLHVPNMGSWLQHMLVTPVAHISHVSVHSWAAQSLQLGLVGVRSAASACTWHLGNTVIEKEVQEVNPALYEVGTLRIANQ